MRMLFLLSAFIPLLAPLGCERASRPPVRTEPKAINAYDVIKLCRFSDEQGPVYFEHGLHADLTDRDGRAIACIRCHHDLGETPAGPPRGCAKCHLTHEAAHDRGDPNPI